jgi:hypothetical protein
MHCVLDLFDVGKLESMYYIFELPKSRVIRKGKVWTGEAQIFVLESFQWLLLLLLLYDVEYFHNAKQVHSSAFLCI